MGDLGSRQAHGAVGTDSSPFGASAYTVAFTPAVMSIPTDYEVYHAAILGPAGSTVRWYVDTNFYSHVARGDINDWDPSQSLYVRPGQSMYFYWSVGAGPVPFVSLLVRTPRILG